MFVAHDMNTNKKFFQKPNILRRKPNASKQTRSIRPCDKTEVYQPRDLEIKSIPNTSIILEPKSNKLHDEKLKKCINRKPLYSIMKPIQRLGTDISTPEVKVTGIQEIGTNVSAKNSLIYVDNTIPLNNSVTNHNQLVNVESFFIGDVISQGNSVIDGDMSQNKVVECQSTLKWCLDLNQDSQNIIIEHFDSSQVDGIYVEEKPDLVNTMVPLSEVSSIHNQESKMLQGKIVTSVTNIRKISMEQLTQSPIKFKCDVSDCKKEFLSEHKLKKHKGTHNKNNNTKPSRQSTLECPVKKVLKNGTEEACGRIFHVRDDLIKHLNEEHTTEEALYRCTECTRRFFWASGLRAHARAHVVRAGRVALACPWPGCSRVFRQPCRLREHARAHTGDKPYPCRYPNCGWSFRTASKLVRHARRHTGDRRHTCAACGCAFLRREHLRDHATRHKEPHARAAHACAHADCKQSFTNMSSLYMHMKKVHRKEENSSVTTVSVVENQESPKVETENIFMVSLLEPGGSIERAAVEVNNSAEVFQFCDEGEGEGVKEEEGDGQCARTHCTWPLPRGAQYHDSEAYVLEEDVQIEQSEGSENNIYTVRSDLFLHGNVLHNEDSEQMGRHVRAPDGDVESAALDADLMLDAPSVHLAQEELYADAVDESSFRVFLLSGEELA